MIKAEELARQFHEIYERLAPQFGYETRKETQDFCTNSQNGRLMVAVCNEILDRHALGMIDLDSESLDIPQPLGDMFQTIMKQMSPFLKTMEQNSKIAVIAKMAAIMQPNHLYIDENLAQQVLDLYNACSDAVRRENEGNTTPV